MNTHTYHHHISQLNSEYINKESHININSFNKHILCEYNNGKHIEKQIKNILFVPYDKTIGILIKKHIIQFNIKILDIPKEIGEYYVYNSPIIGKSKDTNEYTTNIQDENYIFVICPRISRFKWGLSKQRCINYDLCYNIINIEDEIKTEDNWSEEDPRLFIYKDQLCIATTYIYDYNSSLSKLQSLLPSKSSWKYINTIHNIIPYYADNRYNDKVEKNWGYFESNGRLLAVYSINPWIIIDVTYENNVIELCKIEWCNDYKIFGGASPIFYNNKWWLFCHIKSVNNINSTFQCYDTVLITFDKETYMPLDFCPVICKYHLGNIATFLYITGAIIKYDMFLLSGGINDTNCCIVEVPIKYIESILKPISSFVIQ